VCGGPRGGARGSPEGGARGGPRGGGVKGGGVDIVSFWPFNRVAKPRPKRVVDLENDLSDAQAAIDWLRKAVKDLNGRLSSVQRREKAAQDAPEPAIEEPPDIQPPHFQPAQPVPTSHLSRRFRGG